MITIEPDSLTHVMKGNASVEINDTTVYCTFTVSNDPHADDFFEWEDDPYYGDELSLEDLDDMQEKVLVLAYAELHNMLRKEKEAHRG
jgi:hypothetical protein